MGHTDHTKSGSKVCCCTPGIVIISCGILCLPAKFNITVSQNSEYLEASQAGTGNVKHKSKVLVLGNGGPRPKIKSQQVHYIKGGISSINEIGSFLAVCQGKQGAFRPGFESIESNLSGKFHFLPVSGTHIQIKGSRSSIPEFSRECSGQKIRICQEVIVYHTYGSTRGAKCAEMVRIRDLDAF